MPRKLERRKRRTGYMYFVASEVRSNMMLDDILDIVFTRAVEYKKAAKIILEGIKEIAKIHRRRPLWISDSEMSSLINERIGKNKKSLAYRVISEFLVPLGFITYRPDEGRYFISKSFHLALRRLATAYNKWMRT
ncbi:MAG: hypothetical protein NDF54_11865 [archaeon GB-1867-035]|nr:hypothetical protein [Candidatus Culexmicrobium profundum]